MKPNFFADLVSTGDSAVRRASPLLSSALRELLFFSGRTANRRMGGDPNSFSRLKAEGRPEASDRPLLVAAAAEKGQES
jgi:hypothetical protein